MNSIIGLMRLTRPGNMLICFFSVVCGGILGGPPFQRFGRLISSVVNGPDSHSWECRVILAAFSAALILAAGNVFNDVRDIAADRINAPHRPIPSGMISPLTAAIFAAVLTLTGLLFSIILGLPGVATAFFAVLLLFTYDMKLKGVPLAGNTAVALLGGLAFVYGGIAGDAAAQSLLPAGYAVLFHLSRELIKDAADFEGDKAAGITTAATVWGISTACRVSAGVLVALAVIVLLPSVTGIFGPGYLAIITTGVLPVIAYSALAPLRDHSALTLRRIAIILKMDMPVGLVAVLAGFQGI